MNDFIVLALEELRSQWNLKKNVKFTQKRLIEYWNSQPEYFQLKSNFRSKGLTESDLTVAKRGTANAKLIDTIRKFLFLTFEKEFGLEKKSLVKLIEEKSKEASPRLIKPGPNAPPSLPITSEYSKLRLFQGDYDSYIIDHNNDKEIRKGILRLSIDEPNHKLLAFYRNDIHPDTSPSWDYTGEAQILNSCLYIYLQGLSKHIVILSFIGSNNYQPKVLSCLYSTFLNNLNDTIASKRILIRQEDLSMALATNLPRDKVYANLEKKVIKALSLEEKGLKISHFQELKESDLDRYLKRKEDDLKSQLLKRFVGTYRGYNRISDYREDEIVKALWVFKEEKDSGRIFVRRFGRRYIHEGYAEFINDNIFLKLKVSAGSDKERVYVMRYLPGKGEHICLGLGLIRGVPVAFKEVLVELEPKDDDEIKKMIKEVSSKLELEEVSPSILRHLTVSDKPILIGGDNSESKEISRERNPNYASLQEYIGFYSGFVSAPKGIIKLSIEVNKELLVKTRLNILGNKIDYTGEITALKNNTCINIREEIDEAYRAQIIFPQRSTQMDINSIAIGVYSNVGTQISTQFAKHYPICGKVLLKKEIVKKMAEIEIGYYKRGTQNFLSIPEEIKTYFSFRENRGISANENIFNIKDLRDWNEFNRS